MGYYIVAHGTVQIPRSLEIEAVHALKMLNYHHEMKRGGTLGHGTPADPFEARWYSWMPARYHEDPELKTVGDILEMLGFTTSVKRMAGLNVYTVDYDTKTGQEEVFLNVLADYAQISIDVTGEDAQRWRWVNAKAGAPLEHHAANVTYQRVATVREMVERERKMLEEARAQYA
jgi:hypothetical protein